MQYYLLLINKIAIELMAQKARDEKIYEFFKAYAYIGIL